MKKIQATALLVTALTCSMTTFAGNNTATPSPTYFEKITTRNNTSVDLAFSIFGSTYNSINVLAAGGASTYNTSVDADDSVILVMQCFEVEHHSLFADTCKKLGQPIACNNGQHYSTHKIKQIDFNDADLKTCNVTCDDGSNSSCLIN